MKIQITIILALLISLTGVMAMASYCGDGVCNRYSEDYDESNPLLDSYCPIDCGTRINSSWCESTYDLTSDRDCPVCSTGGSSECTTSRISTTDLNNWCSSNGFSNSGNCSGSNGDDSNKYYWIVFLIIGGIIGYVYKKKY